MGKNGINHNPISGIEDDKLGFGEMAKHLAEAFLENDLSSGLVVGVEGTWGSGKSSLVNLMLNELKRKQVVRFSPWLVGNRDDLLHQYFLDLESAIRESLPEDIRDKTRKLMKTYSTLALGTAKILETLSMEGVLGTGTLAKGLELTAGKAEELSSASLSQLNLELRDNLKKLKNPIIVFIDDLDRLEPLEVVEVLRLVRAVADFPEVGYILAYDPENLTSSLKSIGINDGRAFLEKIVQASFRVPNARGFDLRNWLSAEFEALRKEEKLDPDRERRVSSVLHVWAGRYLATPRDVVRTVNSLRLNFVPVCKQVDPGDALFLELVHVHNDHLFQWIQRYVRHLSARADRFYIQDEDATLSKYLSKASGKKEHIPLRVELLEASGIRGKEAQQELIEQLGAHLPGLNHYQWTTKDDYSPPCEFRDKNEVQKYTLGRRLASPRHYSLYFSFSYAAGHLSDEGIASFLELVVTDKDTATAKIFEWAKQSRPQGGKMGEVVLDHLVELRPLITPEEISGLFEVLGQTMDELARNADSSSGYPNFLLGDQNQVFGLIEALPNEQRSRTLNQLFETAPSLAWLAGIIRFNAQPKEDGWASADENAILTEEEFTVLSHQFANRLATEEDPRTLLNTPYFIFLLIAWVQIGDKTRCLDWINCTVSTDVGFLDVVEKMTNRVRLSQTDEMCRIRSKDLIYFFGSVEVPVERLKAIDRDAKDENLRQRANRVLNLIDTSQ